MSIDRVVGDVFLQDPGHPHDLLRGVPGSAADHAVVAPERVRIRAVERGLQVGGRRRRPLLAGELRGIRRVVVDGLQPAQHGAHEALHQGGIALHRVEPHVQGGVGVGAKLLRDVVPWLVPDTLLDALGEDRLGDHRDVGRVGPGGCEDPRGDQFAEGHVLARGQPPAAQQVARGGVGRAAVQAGRNGLAADEIGEVAPLRRRALAGHEIVVAAVDHVADRPQFRALQLGKRAMLRAADEGEGLPRQDGVGVAATGVDRQHLHVQPFVGEEALVLGEIQGKVAGQVHRLRHDDRAGGCPRDVRRREGRAGGGQQSPACGRVLHGGGPLQCRRCFISRRSMPDTAAYITIDIADSVSTALQTRAIS